MKTKAIVLIIVGIILITSGIIVNENSDTTAVSSTEIKNQEIFKNYILDKFSKKFFTIKDSTKNINVIYDFKASYTFNDAYGEILIKTKWLKSIDENKLQISTLEEIELYKSSVLKENSTFFFIFGLGGTQKRPKEIFSIPISVINKVEIKIDDLIEYKKKNVLSGYYFDVENGQLN